MTTPASNRQTGSSSLREWFVVIALVIALGKSVYDLLNNSPSYIFGIALTVFTISVVFYFYQLYRNGKYRILLVYGSILLLLVLGGSWFYYTQYHPNGFPIEKFDARVLPYEGGNEGAPEMGWADLSFYTANQNRDSLLSYQLDYGIPSQDNGWAGFYIDFTQPVDLSRYRAVQFQIQSGDDQARVKLIIKDNARNEWAILLDQVYIKGTFTDPQTVTIPLQKFEAVTLDHVKNIVFHADSDFIRGEHWVRISNLVFIK